MASFMGAVLRLVFKRKAQEGHIDVEHGTPNAAPLTGAGSTTIAPTLGANPNANANAHAHPHEQRSYLVPEDDKLSLFRLMVGISTSPYLGYSESSPVGRRPAANIGIYARVVHSEQKSKDSYKVFSTLINACFFLQIVVAAALTAFGAAGVSHGAVTAFGAINTIIAGLLTFLKGSGLPARLKYYGNEWKKIREFIEQRERDFSRSGCTLDVHEVVATVDKMYNATKREIEMNTPDGYTSVTAGLGRFSHGSSEKIGGEHVSKLEGLASRLKGLDSKVQEVTHHAHQQGREIYVDTHGLEKAIAKEIDDGTAHIDREARERTAQTARLVEEGKREALGQTERTQQAGTQAIKDVGETHRTAVGEMRAAASAQMHRITDKLTHHHDSRHDEVGK